LLTQDAERGEEGLVFSTDEYEVYDIPPHLLEWDDKGDDSEIVIDSF